MAFEKQFTPEQEVKLEDHINYKSQGFITPLGQDKAQRLAKSVDNKMFGTFTDTPLPTATRHFTQQDRELFGLKTNYFEIARQDKPILPKNATEQEYLQWQEKTDEIAFAQAIVSNFNYNVSQDQGKNKKLQEIVSKYGLAFDNLSKEDIEYIVSQEALKQWKDVTDNFGLPKETLLNDTVFWKYTTPEAYRYMATAYNQKFNNGLTGEFSNAWNKQRAHRALDIRYKNGELDYDEYMQMSSFVDDRYSSKSAFDKVELTDEQKEKLEDLGLFDDGQVFENVVGTIGGMAYPIVDNPYKSAGIAALATGASFIPYVGRYLSPMIMSLVWAGDTKDLLDAQGLAQVQSQNPNADREEVLEAISPYTTLGASLDVLSDSFILGGSKLLTPLTKAGQKTLVKLATKSTKLANKATTNSVERVTLKEKLFDASKYIVKPYLAQVAGETVSEGAQDALIDYGADKYLGQESITKSLGVGLESAGQALIPSAVLVGLFNTPHSIALSNKIFRGQQAVNKAIDNAQTTEILANSSLAQNTPNVAEDIFNKANFGNVFLSTKNDINNVLHEQNIPIDTLPKKVQEAINNAKDGEEVKITTADLALCPENARRALSTIASDEVGGLNSSEAIDNLNKEKIEQARQQLQIERSELQERVKQQAEIEKDIYSKLYANSPSTTTKQNSFISKFTANFFSALGQVLGEKDIVKLYKENSIEYKNVQRDVVGTAEKATDLKKVAGMYHNGVINLKKNSDFTSTLHETLHYYFDVLKRYADKSDKVKENLKAFYKWAGLDENNLKDTESYQQEAFVHGFLSYLIAGDNFDIEIFKGASQLLKLMKADFTYEALGAKSAQAKANVQVNNFEKAYLFNGEHKVLPYINNDFVTFVNSMFEGEVSKEELLQEYSLDVDLGDIDNNPNFTDEQRLALREELAKIVKSETDKVGAAVDSFNFIRALRNMLADNSINIDDFILKAKEQLLNSKDVKNKDQKERLFNKLLKATVKYKQTLESAEKKLAKSDIYVFLDKIKTVGFSTRGLTKEQVKEFKARGLLAKEGAPYTLDVKHYANYILPATQDKLGKRIYALLQNRPDKSQAFIDFLIAQPTLKDRASSIALNAFNKELENVFRDKSEKIETTFAKAHKAIGKIFIEHLTKLTKSDKSAKEIIHNIKRIASYDVGQRSLNQTNLRGLFTQARRAQKRLKQNIAQGDLDTAIITARNEYYWNEQAELVSGVTSNILKRVNALKTLVNTDKKKLVNSYDFMTVQLIKAVLQRMGVVSTKDKVNLETVVNNIVSNDSNFVDVCTGIKEQIESNQGYFNANIKDVPIAELLKILDLLENLRSAARANNSYKLGNRIVDKATMVKGLSETLDKHKSKVDYLVSGTDENGNPTASMSPKSQSFIDKANAILGHYYSYINQPEYVFERLDQQEFGGYFHALYQDVHEGVTEYKLHNNEDTKRITQAFSKIKTVNDNVFSPNIAIKTVDNNNKPTTAKWVLGAQGTEFEGRTTLEILAVLLHIGANFKIFLNNNIADNPAITNKAEQLAWKEQLFNKEFLERGIDEGFITNEMLDFCQVVWDINKEKEPKLQQSSLLQNGYTFKQVEGRKLFINHGKVKRELNAGYVPAFVEKAFSQNMIDKNNFDLTELNNQFKENNLSRNPSFIQDRAEGRADKPLSLDLNKILSQIQLTNAYCYTMPAVFRVQKLLNDPNVRPKLDRVAPNLYKDVIEPWLYSCATLKTSNATGATLRFIANLSMRVSQALMVGNFKNVIEQVANIPATIIKTGAWNFLKASIYLNPFTTKGMMKVISDESRSMNMRFNEQIDSFNEVFNKIVIDSKLYNSKKAKAKAMWDNSVYFGQKYGMCLQHVFQNYLDVISYMAGKEKAKQLGLDEKQQIKYAEQVVRQTQGSFDIENTPKITKADPLTKSFCQFGSYFYNMFNLYRTQIELAWTQAGIKPSERLMRTCTVGIFGLLSQSIISEIINSVIGQGDWFADDDEILDQVHVRFMAAPFQFLTGAFPFVGQGLNSYINSYTQGSALVRTGITSPIISISQNFIHALSKLTNEEKEIKGTDVKAMMIFTSVCIPPTTPIMGFLARPIGALYDMEYKERVEPQTTYDLIRYLMTGTASPQSKNGR